MKKLINPLLLLLLLGGSDPLLAIDTSTQKDMPFVTSSKYCVQCHTTEEALSFRTRTTKSCNTYCKTCHEDIGAHHPTNMKLEGTTGKGIALLNDKVACFSCHDLKKKRFDSIPWKAQSLYENLFKSKKVYPTYFMIENNSEGQLCKRCH